MTVTIPTGGLWDEAEWCVDFNHELSLTYSQKICPHCSPIQTRIRKTAYGETYAERYCFCPRVLIATNEGGYATTGVCLDCILEAEQAGKLKAL